MAPDQSTGPADKLPLPLKTCLAYKMIFTPQIIIVRTAINHASEPSQMELDIDSEALHCTCLQ